ncbi:uncharacterized protein LOC122793050 [Protopterus annectens]|uniref:uncharacterized protein LOC122793050 n=1 Tax=Protopterus annectens TaxID=7888 RepID=UPI001CFC2B0D|nr:uncharacterized protein LOC122793050 [Protopterus annectens]XP_043916661.1 uncharacterized protein LOC122793050 [Protopterus annectens]
MRIKAFWLKAFWLAVLIIGLIALMCYLYSPPNRWNISVAGEICSGLTPEQNMKVCLEHRDKMVSAQTITPVKKTKSFVVSAYFDPRKDRIVLIGILYRLETKNFQCYYLCSDSIYSKATETVIHSDHFNFPYGTADFVCSLPLYCKTEYIFINVKDDSKLSNQFSFLKVQNLNALKQSEHDSFDYNFTVCLPAMFGGYDNTLQFVQSLEMYRILGAEQVVLYYTNSSSIMQKVLKYYQQTGFVKVIPWPITSYINVSRGWMYPDHGGDLHYYGQIVTLNDCIYRNMYKSRYVMLNDIDEIILPIKHNTWNELMDFMLRAMPGNSIYYVENHIFPFTVYEENDTYVAKKWSVISGDDLDKQNILQHTYREPDRPNVYNPTKLIVNPRSVLQTSVHSVLEKLGKEIKIPFDVARIYHLRVPLQSHLPKEKLIKDTSLWRYSTLLIERVNNVFKASLLNDKTENSGIMEENQV